MTLPERYDKLFQEADRLLKKYNPCKWNAQTKDCARGTGGCCHGCSRLSEQGCVVDSLACKLWICPEIRLNMPEHVLDEFRLVWEEAQKYNLLTFRGCKQVSVKNAKYFHRRSCPLHVQVNKYGESTWILGE